MVYYCDKEHSVDIYNEYKYVNLCFMTSLLLWQNEFTHIWSGIWAHEKKKDKIFLIEKSDGEDQTVK